MARRRRRSLSGSPEHHKSVENRVRLRAKDFATRSMDAARAGDCTLAYDNLLDAAELAGKMEAHSEEAGRKAPAGNVYADAFVTFGAKCVLRHRG